MLTNHSLLHVIMMTNAKQVSGTELPKKGRLCQSAAESVVFSPAQNPAL